MTPTDALIDPVFARPELAGLYDLFNPWMVCDDFYKARAVASGGPVLDLGCGTGMLACASRRRKSTSSAPIRPTVCCGSPGRGLAPRG